MKGKFKNIILLGEMHGTEGNLWALQKLINEIDREYSEITVALELPTEWNKSLHELEKGTDTKLQSLIDGSGEAKSGIISKKHIVKYLELAKSGVKFVAIRNSHNDWNTTDKVMAENILQVNKKDTGVTIATLGNLHVEKSESAAMWCEGYTCHPVGELLKDKSTSILIQYANSKYINFGKIGKLDNKDCSKGQSINIYNDKKYDYKICIRDAGTVID